MSNTENDIFTARTAHWTKNPGWWALIVSVAAIVFSGFALYLSYSDPSRLSAESILEQAPDVIINWQLKSINIGGNKIIPPNFTIRNIGPIAASQLRVWILKWDIFPGSTPKIQSSQTDCNWVFPSIIPFKDTTVVIPSACITHFSLPQSRKVVEIRFQYQRDVDLKQYLKRLYAIQALDGSWKSIGNLKNDSLEQPLLLAIRNLPIFEAMYYRDEATSVELDE